MNQCKPTFHMRALKHSRFLKISLQLTEYKENAGEHPNFYGSQALRLEKIFSSKLWF